VTEAEPVFDPANRTLTLRSATSIEAALADPALVVRPKHEPIPNILAGTRAGQIFGNLARMTDGEAHAPRRAVVASIISSFDLDVVETAARDSSIRLLAESTDLNDWAVNVSPYTLGTILGIDPENLPELARNAAAFARAISPGASANETESGISGADELREIFARLAPTTGGDPEIWISNVIGLFFQSYDSMAGVLGNTLLFMQAHPDITDVRVAIRRTLHETPPIRNTRRFAAADTELGGTLIAAGSSLLIDLESAMKATGSGPSLGFGAGPHACPGQVIAFTIAAAAVEVGPRLEGILPPYYPNPNASVPDFRGFAIPGSTT
jgi:cytochrome P450